VIGIFVIRRPAEKIAIVVVRRAVLPNLTATALLTAKKKRKENGKGKSPGGVRKSDLFFKEGQSKGSQREPLLLDDPTKSPLRRGSAPLLTVW
jgi:hypothetical protein